MADDHGRAEDDAVANAANHQAIADAGIANDWARRAFGPAKAMIGVLLGDNFNRADEPEGAHLADQRMVIEGGHGLRNVGAGIEPRPLDQVLAFHDLDIFQSHSAGGGVA